MIEQERRCCVVTDATNWEAVLTMPRSSVATDWWGNPLARPFRYALGRDASHLVFVSEAPQRAPPPAAVQRGAFVADLAEPETRADTAELFVMREDGRYFEVHVSPDGAWWYMEFSQYRVREPGRVPVGVEITTERHADSWVGAIRIPFAQLPILPGEVARFQATLALCSGSEPRYITSAGTPHFAPDFHDKRGFLQVRV